MYVAPILIPAAIHVYCWECIYTPLLTLPACHVVSVAPILPSIATLSASRVVSMALIQPPISTLSAIYLHVELSFSHRCPLSLPSRVVECSSHSAIHIHSLCHLCYMWNCHSAIDAHYLCHLGLLSVALIQPSISTLSLPSMLHVVLSFSHRYPLSVPSRVVSVALIQPSIFTLFVMYLKCWVLNFPTNTLSLSTIHVVYEALFRRPCSFSQPVFAPSILCVALIQPSILTVCAIYVKCRAIIQPSISNLSIINVVCVALCHPCV